MRAKFRTYDHGRDYEAVGDLLVRTHRVCGGHINWLQPRWEYMHFHPLIRGVDLGAIGVWEAGGRVVGVAHPEHDMGVAYFELDPDYPQVMGPMLEHAAERISVERDGERRLRVFIGEDDAEFQRIAASLGFECEGDGEPMSHLPIDPALDPPPVPEGFRLQPLAEENDLRKVKRVMYRGFNHGAEPPDDETADQAFMQSAPGFRPDLHMVAVAPDGQFASYCGMWLEPVSRSAYVEPVATDPAYRRLGVGRATVLEAIRRCGDAGAEVACVGTTMPFYLSFGFHKVYGNTEWRKRWEQSG